MPRATKTNENDATVWTVREGAAVVRVRESQQNSRGHTYPVFVVSWPQSGGRRQRKRIRDQSKALDFAKAMAARLSKGAIEGPILSASEVADYRAARDRLDGSGLSLEMAADQLMSAIALLGGRPLLPAVAEWVKRNPTDWPDVRPKALIEEYAKRLAADGARHDSIRAFRCYLKPFGEAFRCKVASVSEQAVDDWLRKRKVAPGSRNRARGYIATIMAFAERQGLRQKWDIKKVAIARDDVRQPRILTPSQMSEFLHGVSDQLRPVLVLVGFCGLRTSAVSRKEKGGQFVPLDWSTIHLEGEPHVKAPNHMSKSRRPIIHRIPENAVRWLLPLRKAQGPVTKLKPDSVRCAIMRSTKALGIPYSQNALRASFMSYTLALTEDPGVTGWRSGTSSKMVVGTYADPALRVAAKEWFSIVPREDYRKIIKISEG